MRAFVVLAFLVSLTLVASAAARDEAAPGPRAQVSPSFPSGAVPSAPQAIPGAQWALASWQSPPRTGHGFVYDPRMDLFFLFGGEVSPTGVFTNSTWNFNLPLDSWTNASPVVSPSPRAGFGMVYDSRADRVIVFGGTVGVGVLTNETWVFDPMNITWTERFPIVGPTPRTFPAMSYDEAADRVILFGGLDNSFAIQSDTWSYDLTTDLWTRVAAVGPTSRFGASLTYDPIAQRDILFGGLSLTGIAFTPHFDTWSFDAANATWTNENPATHPSPRAASAFAFDSIMDRAILFGGTNSSGPGSVAYNDTWVYSLAANTWTNVTPVVSPSPRLLSAMAFSPYANRTVLFGGADVNGNASNETWSFYDGPGLPTAPTVTSISGTGGKVTMTWKPPYSDGGSPITNYTIYRSTSPGAEVLYATVGDVLTYTDTAVVVGTTYFYEVAAVNGQGQGPASSETSATPVITSVVPSPPRNLAATAGNAQVTLSWQAPASNGSSPLTGYNVYRGIQSGTETLFASLGVVLSYLDTAVTNGVTYVYVVTAVNGAGESAWTPETSATPTAPPAPDTTPPMITIISPSNNSVLRNATVTVTGTASDDVAVQKIELSTDGTTWTAATGASSWSGTVTLHSGSNTIYARATDTSGNQRIATITVTVSVPNQAPQGLDPVLLVGIAIVVMAALLGVALVVRRRRKRPTSHLPPPPPPP